MTSSLRSLRFWPCPTGKLRRGPPWQQQASCANAPGAGPTDSAAGAPSGGGETMDQTINRLTKWGLLAGLVLVAWMLIEAIQRPGPEPRQTEVVVETCDHGICEVKP